MTWISSKELLQLINEFSEGAGYKININKSVALLYDQSLLLEMEFKKAIPFTIAIKMLKNKFKQRGKRFSQ